ncbi:hypothetical protein [Oscillibacter sp.]|uniref:hypothetical protein n=1 Tax=Oscillibacter sp. TaxID=1945593 RepID=UPI00289F7AD8|nr:hypothetical protein [Oscillibacter sp.]
MPRIKPSCPPDCPRRSPSCHNPDTCPAWRDYCARKTVHDAAVRAARNEELLMCDYRGGILREFTRRVNPRRKGRNL